MVAFASSVPPYCPVENTAVEGGKWIYSYSYVCGFWHEYSYVELNWMNVLGADEVLLRAVGNGDSNFVTLNGASVVDNANSKNAFALTGQSCGVNVCWANDAFRNNSVPIQHTFSGNLQIKAGGNTDAYTWGGSGSIWGVLVREPESALDSDGDGVLDDSDDCPSTAPGDAVNDYGCSAEQTLAITCPIDDSYKNHGAYVSCVSKTSETLLEEGLLTEEEKDAIVSEAAKSNIGKKNK